MNSESWDLVAEVVQSWMGVISVESKNIIYDNIQYHKVMFMI